MEIIDNLLDLPANVSTISDASRERAAIILLDIQEKVNKHEATRLGNAKRSTLADWRNDITS